MKHTFNISTPAYSKPVMDMEEGEIGIVDEAYYVAGTLIMCAMAIRGKKSFVALDGSGHCWHERTEMNMSVHSIPKGSTITLTVGGEDNG